MSFVYSGSSQEYRREMIFFLKKNYLFVECFFVSFSVGFILIFVFVVDDAAAAAEWLSNSFHYIYTLKTNNSVFVSFDCACD